MNPQLLVIAKEPRAGHVKTRLCPPCTPEQAAAVAAASLHDTLVTGDATRSSYRTLAISGSYLAPPGWRMVRQRGYGLGQRLVHAFVDSAVPGLPTLLIGMDTPQVNVAQLAAVGAGLWHADAVLGPSPDGGWWALALREPADAIVLNDVPMSTSDTCRLTLRALRARGLTVAVGPSIRDIDTAGDAHAVAAEHPHRRFAAAVREHVPPVSIVPRR